MRTYNNHAFPSRRLGFSLIETVIVMAIVGLIIGSIWIAATGTRSQRQAAKTIEGIFYIAAQVQRKLQNNDTYGSITNINTVGIQMGLFPTDWVQNTRVLVPGGGIAALMAWPSGIITVQLQGLEHNQCQQLLQRLSALSESRTKFIRAVFDVTGNQWVTFPIPTGSLSTYCPGSPTTSLEVHFTL